MYLSKGLMLGTSLCYCYVDDMLLVGHDHDWTKIGKLKDSLSKSFALKDSGLAKQILGMSIWRDRQARRLWVFQ